MVLALLVTQAEDRFPGRPAGSHRDDFCLRPASRFRPLCETGQRARRAATASLCLGLLAVLWLLQFAAVPASWAQGDSLLWQFAGGDVRIREITHRREANLQAGIVSEQIVIEAGPGTAAYYLHAVLPAPVIQELRVRLPVWSDRPGIQVFLSIVLPRMRHPQTQTPISLLVAGSQTRVAGQWEWLAVQDVPLLLEREARSLRLQLRRDVDLKGAYVDGVVLNLYGGPGTTRVMIGPVEWSGYLPGQLPEPPGGRTPDGAGGTPAGPTAPDSAPAWMNGPTGGAVTAAWLEPAEAAAAESLPLIEMTGSVLRVRGRAFFPRALEYQGEPPELVRRLGFNTLWVRRPVDKTLLFEARRQGLWLILAPGEEIVPRDGSPLGRTISSDYDGVLAWDMGTQTTPWDVQTLHRRAELLRSLDPTPGRPLLAEPLVDLLSASRAVEAMIVGRAPCFSELELTDYAMWLRSRSLLARPGTPIWVTVQTQPDPALCEQWRRAGAEGEHLNRVPPEQIRLLTYLSLTAGARALLFRSRTSLAETDPGTEERRLALELMNRELEWIEPFLASGQFLALVPSNVPEVVGALFRAERARLLVPLWLGRKAQYVTGQAAAEAVTFVVPGVPESNTAYLLLPGTLEPVTTERVAGGTRLTIREFGPTSLVAMTQDPAVLSYLMERARTSGTRIVQLERQLADLTFRRVQTIHQQLVREGPFIPQAERWFRLAAEELASADRALSAGDDPAAIRHIHRAVRPLLLIRRIDWESTIPGQDAVVTWPLATSFETLPQFATLRDQLSGGAWTSVSLPGGDFESAEQITAQGWELFQHPLSGVFARAEVTSAAARSGRMGLLLAARSADSQQEKSLLESPPLWIRSPAIKGEPGDWVRIEGWVFIPRPITGSVDGLVIVDSLGGDALAHRLSRTVGWRPFRIIRRLGAEGSVTLTFILSGLGEVCLDDISVSLLKSLPAPGATTPPDAPLVPIPPSQPPAGPAGPLARLPFIQGGYPSLSGGLRPR